MLWRKIVDLCPSQWWTKMSYRNHCIPLPLFFKMDFTISTKYALKSLVTIVLLLPLSLMNKNSQTLKSTLITNAVTRQGHVNIQDTTRTRCNTNILVLWTRKVLCGIFLRAIYKFSLIHLFTLSAAQFSVHIVQKTKIKMSKVLSQQPGAYLHSLLLFF